MNQNETGRSMVEMLGVLAIMGVLTVGGVAGYRYAIDKMDANEIVDELIKRAVTASQQRILGRTINLSEYGNNGAIAGVYGVAPTDRYNGNGFQFALSVQDVPQRVCDMILNSDWTLPREIIVGGIVVTEDTSCAEGNNDMTFAFNNTLSNDAELGNEGETTEDLGQKNCSGKGTWNGTNCECNDGFGGDDCTETRDPNECSGHGKTYINPYGNNSCFCDRGWSDGGGADVWLACSDKKELCNSRGNWVGCGCQCDIGWSGFDCSEKVDKCNSRGYFNYFIDLCVCLEGWSGNDCSSEGSIPQYQSDTASLIVSATPVITGSIPQPQSDTASLIVTTMPATTVTETVSPEISESISNPEVSVSGVGQCESGQFFSECGGGCIPCSTSSSYPATAEECAKCDDTSTLRVMSSGGYCALPCGSGKVMVYDGYCVSPCSSGEFMDSYGSCYSCSTSSSYSATAEECAKCDDTSTPRTMYGGRCGLKSCSSGQFMSNIGSCYSCSYSYIVSDVTTAECAKCDGTSTPRIMSHDGYYCALPCSSGEFMSTNGICHSCLISYGEKTTAEECAKCDNTSTPRTMYGDYCGLKSCPSGRVLSANGDCVLPCESGQFMCKSGSCYSCSTSFRCPATAAECAKCDGTSAPRVMSYEGNCALPCSSGEFMSKYGDCIACSTSYGVEATAAECAKCDDTSTPRYMSGGYCRKR